MINRHIKNVELKISDTMKKDNNKSKSYKFPCETNLQTAIEGTKFCTPLSNANHLKIQ